VLRSQTYRPGVLEVALHADVADLVRWREELDAAQVDVLRGDVDLVVDAPRLVDPGHLGSGAGQQLANLDADAEDRRERHPHSGLVAILPGVVEERRGG